jgi:hypothetical protein
MKKLPLINIVLITFLCVVTSCLAFNYFQIKSQLSKIDLGLNKLTEDQYTFILREMDNNYLLITFTITILFGFTAFFINYSVSGKILNVITKLEQEHNEQRSNQKTVMLKMHKLEGDLNIAAYEGLRLNSEFLLDKEENYDEASQYYLFMAERVALAISSYKLANFDFDKNYYTYIEEDLTSIKDYVDSIDKFVPDHLSYVRYLDLKKNIDNVLNKKVSKILHDIGSKISFVKLED